MTDKPAEQFFTPRHARLFRIARLANFFAWGALIPFILAGILQIEGTFRIYSMAPDWSGPEGTRNAISVARSGLTALQFLMNGAIYSLVLKAISVGLNMIIETDLNYRGQALEESHE